MSGWLPRNCVSCSVSTWGKWAPRGKAERWTWPKSLATLLNIYVMSPNSGFLILGDDPSSLLLIRWGWDFVTCNWKCSNPRTWGDHRRMGSWHWQGLPWSAAFLICHSQQAVSLESSGNSASNYMIRKWIMIMREGTKPLKHLTPQAPRMRAHEGCWALKLSRAAQSEEAVSGISTNHWESAE